MCIVRAASMTVIVQSAASFCEVEIVRVSQGQIGPYESLL